VNVIAVRACVALALLVLAFAIGALTTNDRPASAASPTQHLSAVMTGFDGARVVRASGRAVSPGRYTIDWRQARGIGSGWYIVTFHLRVPGQPMTSRYYKVQVNECPTAPKISHHPDLTLRCE
jgi:hypothetical protein